MDESKREKEAWKDLYSLIVGFLRKVLEDFLNYSDIITLCGREGQEKLSSW